MGIKGSCLQENLARGLNIVSRAVSTRSTLDILTNVMISSDNGRFKLSATDLDMSITVWIGASIEEEGALTVPARNFTDLVSKLSPERIDLESFDRDLSLHLNCGATKASFKGRNAEDYPIIPQPEEGSAFLPIQGDVLAETISMVAFAAAKDDSRPILTGVLLDYADGMLTMAAADGFRLSVRQLSVDTDTVPAFKVVVPARSLIELARVAGEVKDPVYIGLSREKTQILFLLPDVHMTAHLIEGKFPDWEQIIPSDLPTHTVVPTAELLRACQRADIFAREANHTVRLSIEPVDGMIGLLRVRATASEMGEGDIVVDASIEGESMEIAFNARYLIDVLSVISADRVEISTSRPDRPGVIKPVEAGAFTHVVMPMHIGR